jgi:hypothetical protein
VARKKRTVFPVVTHAEVNDKMAEFLEGKPEPSGDPFIDAKAEQEAKFQKWMQEVDVLFMQRTCCDWANLCGDDEPVRTAFGRQETPQYFVDFVCEKYGLGD